MDKRARESKLVAELRDQLEALPETHELYPFLEQCTHVIARQDFFFRQMSGRLMKLEQAFEEISEEMEEL